MERPLAVVVALLVGLGALLVAAVLLVDPNELATLAADRASGRAS